MPGYFLHNFGCRASAADGEAIAAAMEQGGAVEAGRAQADVVVVNTCAVTEQAERSARALIRRVRRENPGARVVVTGCYAQRAPAELRGLGGVDVVVGNSHKGWWRGWRWRGWVRLRGVAGWLAAGLGLCR